MIAVTGVRSYCAKARLYARDLCTLTGASDTTSLQRVYSLLTEEQRNEELVERFSCSVPGESVVDIPHFLWRRVFSFNIDDVLEKIYEATLHRKQALIPLNFDSPFEPTPVKGELNAIHLHGWVRRPDSGFVFSATEYARVMRALNPWMHLLSEILATEPFIIAGTSLNEIDLEFYLSHRNPATPRRGGGPSLLIEPFPDVATESDCERYGLILIPTSLRQFMEWLKTTFPSPPSVYDLTVPDESTLFSEQLTPTQLLRFFSDFELVGAIDHPLSPTPSPFLYGREAQWEDLNQHVDIERGDNARTAKVVEACLDPEAVTPPRMVVVLDEPGTGKTTVIKRVAHGRARAGKHVLSLRTLSRIDTHAAIDCLSHLSSQVLILIDGIADHVDQITEILENPSVRSKVVVLGAERSYRKPYLDIVLSDTEWSIESLQPFTLNESEQLIERYRQFGLVAVRQAIQEPQKFARRIVYDPVAVSICRILNDFRPLDDIIKSLIQAATPDHLLPYVCVCLAQHCYSAGLRYSILQAIAGPSNPITKMFDIVPLRLTRNVVQDDFVITLNPTIGEQYNGPQFSNQ